MTLLLRAIFLGYALATSAAIWLSASGMAVWTTILAAWIGGSVLGVALAAVGASLWPTRPVRRSSFIATKAEFRLWDEDLALDLINAGLRPKRASAGQGACVPQAG